MLPNLLVAYSALFAILAFKNFRLALGVFIIALPGYLIRFNIGPFPSTLLELNFIILFLVWLIKFARKDFPTLRSLISDHKIFVVSCFLFLVSSVAGIFISDMWYYSLGQWRAYFLEPMVVFVMLVGRTEMRNVETQNFASLQQDKSKISPYDLILFLTLSTVSISIVAIIQKFTGQLYPPALWDDELFGRVTSFFTSPNSIGLYIGPLLLLTLSLLVSRAHRAIRSFTIYYLLFTILLAAIALFFTKSLGAWAAVAGGLLVFIYFIGYKKTALGALIVGILLMLSPPTQHVLATKGQSTLNRVALWQYSWSYLTASPKNFVFGAGIRQFFRKVQKPNYDAKELERLIYPHNIFLNFWTEIGLVGMLAFVGMFACLTRITYHITRNSDWYLGAGLAAALAVILVHGLIDVPYFKNDLAMIFWIIASLSLVPRNDTF